MKACRTSLQAIKDFKNGDDDFAELARDVEIFNTFVQGVERVLCHQQKTHGNLLSKDMQSALQEAHSTVAKLYEKLERVKKADTSSARRIRWLQGRAELEKLRGQTRNHNLRLNGFISLICA
jgi:hypothetical protein